VDTTSVPANYAVSRDAFLIHVAPISTVTQDVPVRALRSISGKVFLRISTPARFSDTQKPVGGKADPGESAVAAEETKLVPLADAQITAGYGVVKTDNDGNFLLRNLPAGNLTITLVPLKPLPQGLQLPTGPVKMPPEPIQVEGATIVISNPELVPYLTGKSAEQVRDSAQQTVLKAELNYVSGERRLRFRARHPYQRPLRKHWLLPQAEGEFPLLHPSEASWWGCCKRLDCDSAHGPQAATELQELLAPGYEALLARFSSGRHRLACQRAG
jgi:hypothetical protein